MVSYAILDGYSRVRQVSSKANISRLNIGYVVSGKIEGKIGVVGEGKGVDMICDNRCDGIDKGSRDDSGLKVGRRKEEVGKERKTEGEKVKRNSD